jgi:glycerophosphoryl diester phosphodiesterase
VVIERDNLQGAAALFKKLYVVDFRDVDEDGFLVKREVADLLHINPGGVPLAAKPGDVGLGDEFAFPFQTIEDVLPLGKDRLLVLCDNNFPFSNGRNPAKPDPSEAIVIRVPRLRG